MKTGLFTADILMKLRMGLPHGAQTKIAKKRGIRPEDVYKILHGQKILPSKCNYLDVLNDAIEMYELQNIRLTEIKEAIETINKE